MCEPLAILGTALATAGALVNNQQQNAAIEAQNRANRDAQEMSRQARRAELARQQVLEEEARGRWEQAAEDLAPQNRTRQQDEATTRFVQRYDTGAQTSQEGQYLSGQNEIQNQEVRQHIARQINAGAQAARQRAAALARLSAYGTVEQAQNANITNTNNQLTTLGGLRRGSLGVANFEQQVPAVTVRPGTSPLGDILTGVGGLAARAGGRGMSLY